MLPRTLDKLNEAEYFLKQIHEVKNLDHFRYNLSAFVTAICSALEILNKEANDKKLNDWRRSEFKKIEGTEFYKIIDKNRNKAVHHATIKPGRTDAIVYVQPIKLSISVVTASEGTKAQAINTIPIDTIVNQNKSSSRHFFAINHDKDILTICSSHFEQVRKLVQECNDKYKKA